MGASTVTVRIYRVDDTTLRFTLTNSSDGTAYDLTGATIKLVWAPTKGGTPTFTKTITETLDALQGQILAPATNGIADIFINDVDVPVTLGTDTDTPPVKFHVGAKVKTTGGKFHTILDAPARLALEVMLSDF